MTSLTAVMALSYLHTLLFSVGFFLLREAGLLSCLCQTIKYEDKDCGLCKSREFFTFIAWQQAWHEIVKGVLFNVE